MIHVSRLACWSRQSQGQSLKPVMSGQYLAKTRLVSLYLLCNIRIPMTGQVGVVVNCVREVLGSNLRQDTSVPSQIPEEYFDETTNVSFQFIPN
jgi:hypothetical protein